MADTLLKLVDMSWTTVARNLVSGLVRNGRFWLDEFCVVFLLKNNLNLEVVFTKKCCLQGMPR